MAGHSKWANIKRRKGVVDAARGKIFTRLTREIQVAARHNPDPDSNFALRLAVDRARAENMPRDTIERAIKRGSGQDKDAAAVEEVTYEGYALHGIALIIECLTDNRNRTIAEIRRVFNRSNCALAEPNAVAWQFTRRGLILMDTEAQDPERSAEDLYLQALDAGAEDIEEDNDFLEIYTLDTDLYQVSVALGEAGLTFTSMELIMHPQNLIDLSSHEGLSVLRMVETLEELDDVKKVYHNLNLMDEVLAELVA